MKNILRICSFVVLLVVNSTTGYTDEQFPFIGEIIKESVNIRAGASTNFERLDKLTQGSEVTIIAKQFDWYKVQLPASSKVYIRADYLKLLQNSSAEIIGDKVNMRALPNSNSTSLGLLLKGEKVNVVIQVNGWWQILPPTKAYGWIRSDFVGQRTFKDFTIKNNQVSKAENLSKKEEIELIEVKGVLMPAPIPSSDYSYELLTENKIKYLIHSSMDLSRFKSAVVIVKGNIQKDLIQQYEYPVLNLSYISLLL